MRDNIENFSLALWDHKDKFICLLKAPNSEFEGQTYNEYFSKKINGEKTLNFSIPMYIFNKELQTFEINEKWQKIFNEEKIRLTYSNKDETISIEEFVLKNFVESRDGEQKIAECECESLAVYELGKIGWGITFGESTVTDYELGYTANGISNCPNLLTIDYWIKKILYKESKYGRVTTENNHLEYDWLFQGMQLRSSGDREDLDGNLILNGTPIDSDTGLPIDEPTWTNKIANLSSAEISALEAQYSNSTGWTWEVHSTFQNDPNKTGSELYENPAIVKYIEKQPGIFTPYCYQKEIGQLDSEAILREYPISQEDINTWTYVTDERKRIITSERSNIFSIIQTICEQFEVWVDFVYTYDTLGKITSRKMVFKTEAINNNIIFDFSYGKNLRNCARTTNSDDLITKLFVPDVDSELVDGNVISIQLSPANLMRETYLYNFDYFYNLGLMTENDKIIVDAHSAKIHDYNNWISTYQNYLSPLYDKKNSVSAELDVQSASLTALREGIQDLQEKVDAIPYADQIIESWSENNTANNHIGEIKTIVNNGDGTWTLSFGRDDVLYDRIIEYQKTVVNDDGTIVTDPDVTILPGSTYVPRYYNNISHWSKGNTVNDNDSNFIVLSEEMGYRPIRNTEEGMTGFISGITFLSDPANSYCRIRYKYAPLIFYYIQIGKQWDSIKEVESNIADLTAELEELQGRITALELQVNKILQNKNDEIHFFELKYKPYIREGYWQPSFYQSQSTSEVININPSNLNEYFHTSTELLSEMNMNDSIHNFSYYIVIDDLDNVDIDSVTMTTKETISNEETIIPRNRYSDYNLYNGVISSTPNDHKLILAISPELIDTYDLYNDTIGSVSKQYKSYLSYTLDNGTSYVDQEFEWHKIGSSSNDDPSILTRYFYLSDDNILSSTLQIYGINSESGIVSETYLEPYTDYSYLFESAAYVNGLPVNMDDNLPANTVYDYVLKVELNLTNTSNNFSDYWKITYSTETTLQYFYNDAVATLEDYCIPQVSYDISIVNLAGLEEYKDYKPEVGQKVPIYDTEMGFNGLEGFITEIEYNLERPEETSITISSYKDKFEDIFQKITATTTTVSYNESGLLTAAESFSSDGSITSDVFQSSLNNNDYLIKMGTGNNEVTIDKTQGITLRDLSSGSGVKLIGNGIFLTPNMNDSPILWTSGITGNGINASTLVSGNIDTKKINIWNASEGQIRFVWNEQGLFAYGDTLDTDSIDNKSESIDYNKYVKFSYDGLQFQQEEDGVVKSAVDLGWNGLKIIAQDGSIKLSGDNGLEVFDGSLVQRLQLGKLFDSTYGLLIKDSNSNIVMRTDSTGQLWLSQKFNIGGASYSTPDAGLYGSSSPSTEYQMGIIGPTDPVNWSQKAIRYWAGPQTKTAYLANRNLEVSDLSGTALSTYNSFDNNEHPCFAQFKVDEDGLIIASGIDVGGWVGEGNFLRSADYESILRSRDYGDGTGLPVIAIGKYGTLTDGTDYNFRVYKDGSLNIGNGSFSVSSSGAITAGNASITGGPAGGYALNLNNTFKVTSEGVMDATGAIIRGSVYAEAGSIGGWEIGTVVPFGLFKTDGTNTTGLNPYTDSTGNVIFAGPTNDPYFKVYGNGNVYFRGDITAYYGGQTYTGVDSTELTLTINGVSTKVRVVHGLIVGV